MILFNPKIEVSLSKKILTTELYEIGVSSEEIERLVSRSESLTVKLENISLPSAHMLKEEIILSGGYATYPENHGDRMLHSTVLFLVGNSGIYQEALKKLEGKSSELKAICQETNGTFEKFQCNRFHLHSPRFKWDIHKRTLVMGIMNITPDSFSDGGKFMDPQMAIDKSLEMKEEGADIIDVGAESSRPGSDPVSSQEELRRLLPVIRPLLKLGHIPISVDTYKAEVARIMLAEGVDIINDISSFTFDQNMPEVLAQHDVPVIIMHTPGPPKTMQQNTKYRSLISDILLFLRQAIERGKKVGMEESRFIVDPGIGFGKTGEQNLEIISLLSTFRSLGCPLMIGVSRKAFIGKILDLPPDERIEGTAAAVVFSIMNGANIIRVHDVKAMTRVAKMADALKDSG